MIGRFGELLSAGGRAVVLHRWLLAVVYGAQVLVSAAVGVVVSWSLAAAFAHEPAFDRAVDGDPVAMITSLTAHPALVTALAWTILAAAVVWGIASWFIKGGLIGALLDNATAPTAAAGARRFGAAGATTLLPYARLALLSAIPYAIVGAALGIGIAGPLDSASHALSPGDVIRGVALGATPGILLCVVVNTAMDYARIDLSLAPDGNRVAWRALVRAFKLVATHPITLAHALVYIAAVGGVTAIYTAATWDTQFAGAAGAVGLFALRQVVAALRFSAHVALIAGQVRYAR